MREKKDTKKGIYIFFTLLLLPITSMLLTPDAHWIMKHQQSSKSECIKVKQKHMQCLYSIQLCHEWSRYPLLLDVYHTVWQQKVSVGSSYAREA